MTRPIPLRRGGSGVMALLVAEAVSAAIGFAVVVRWARSLGPRSFARVEIATAVAGVLLVLVRGGVESIALREASRRPRLLNRWAGLALAVKLAIACGSLGLLTLGALALGGDLGKTVAVGGLVLIPSALLVDLGWRASVRLGPVAIAGVVRAGALACAAWALVHGPADTLAAAGCLALAETVAAVALMGAHLHHFGRPRLGRSWRAARVLAHRGGVATLARFGRVGLFAADAMALGFLASWPIAGPYAAARRIVFALIGLGMVYPSAVAPLVARAWLDGSLATQRLLTRVTETLMALALPASLGLILTAEGWMRHLFGESYRGGGLALAVVAARLPLLLLAALDQTALVALRRERDSWRLIAGACGLAAVSVPIGAWAGGPLGVGGALLVVEGALTVGGRCALHRLGLVRGIVPADSSTLCGCAAMLMILLGMGDGPVVGRSLAGAMAYMITFAAVRWGWTPLMLSKAVRTPKVVAE